jgi:hypothetical protein
MTIIHPFPPSLAYSPYLDELYRVLKPISLLTGAHHVGNSRLLFGRATRILHLHFFDEVVQRPSKFSTWLRYVAWIMSLMLLRWRGVIIVWTVHNATPHECMHPDIARRTTQHVLNQCHASQCIIMPHVRCPSLSSITATPITIIPHGHTEYPFWGHSHPINSHDDNSA